MTRRRLDPTLQVDVYEVMLGDEHLMPSLFTVAETELSAPRPAAAARGWGRARTGPIVNRRVAGSGDPRKASVVVANRRRIPSRGAVRACLLAVAVALSATACGGGDDDTPAAEVQPFAQVQQGEVAIGPDPAAPGRAIFRVETTEPMICAIVWGEDESFGRFNNSLSMNGTGIVDHDVVLPDVEAGETYSYVLQGTTADGTLYRSDLATFRIDPDSAPTTGEPTGVARGENLALGATVTEASSEFSDSFAAELAIDDDTATEWATADDGDDGFIVLDLGSEQQVTGIDFVTRSMADGSAVTSTYTVSVDGAAPLGPYPAGTPAQARPNEVDVTGRQLRFEVEDSSGGNVGAVEIRVYAPASG